MPSDLSGRIVGLVDTAAPPIDVEQLAQRLAEGEERDDVRRAPSLPPLRRRIWAFVGAFAAALVLVGGALGAGVWLHEPEARGPRGFADSPAATNIGTSGWWWIALALVVVSLGAVALVASRRRTQRPGEEDAMQTMEKRTEAADQPVIEKLTRQRRWLVIAMAFVLVVAAVAIGWLIAENRSLDADLDAAVWPAESELTVRQQSMVDVTQRFWSAWNAEDFDTLMSLYSPLAVHSGFSGGDPSLVDTRHRSMMEGWRALLGEYEVVRMVVVGSFVIHVAETGFGQRDAYTFRIGGGDEPLIVSSYHDASTGAG